MSLRTLWRCLLCRDSGFQTTFWLEHVDGRRIKTWDVLVYAAAKREGFYEAIQSSCQRCTAGCPLPGFVAEAPASGKKRAGGDF